MKPKELRAGIVCSMFHRDLAQALLSGALKELAKASAGGGRAAGAPQTDGAGGGQPIDLLKPPDLKKLQKKGLNEPPIIIKPLLRLVPGRGRDPPDGPVDAQKTKSPWGAGSWSHHPRQGPAIMTFSALFWKGRFGICRAGAAVRLCFPF